MIIVAVYVSKGGVGKTTLAAHIAGALAAGNVGSVCALDLDPQGLLANRFGRDAGSNMTRFVEEHPVPYDDIIVRDVRPHLDLVPSNATLSPVRYQRGSKLATHLRDLKDRYDVIVLDLPPEVPDQSTLGFAALRAADAVIVPVEGELQSVERARVTLHALREMEGKRRFGWVASKVDARTTRWEYVLQPLIEEYGDQLIAMVPRVSEVEKVLDRGRLAWEQAPAKVARFTDAIMKICEWVLEG